MIEAIHISSAAHPTSLPFSAGVLAHSALGYIAGYGEAGENSIVALTPARLAWKFSAVRIPLDRCLAVNNFSDST